MSLPEKGLGKTGKGIPLTPMQEAMVFDSIRDASFSRYLSLLHYRLLHPADAIALEKRFEALCRFYPSLRTRFFMDENGTLSQDFPTDHLPGFSVHDLSDMTDSQQDQTIEEWFSAARDQGMNPFQDRLCKLVLFIRSDSAHEMGLVFHHAVLDGWSVTLLLSHLFSDTPLTGRSVPFSRYVHFLKKRESKDDLTYWERRLEGAASGLCLPGYRVQEAGSPVRGKEKSVGREDLEFKVAGGDDIRKLARRLRLSPGRVLQAAWALLMCRYNDGKALFGNIIAGRMGTIPGVMDMVGMCINTIPVRVELSEEETFSSWVAGWAKDAAADERHGFVSAAGFRQCLPRDVTYLNHLFVVDPEPPKDGPVLIGANGELAAGFIAGIELGKEIRGVFSFDPGRYESSGVRRIATHFRNIIEAVIQYPDIRLKDISILSEDEKALLLKNEPSLGEKDDTLVRMWRDAVIQHPNEPALVFRNTCLTYKVLAQRIERLARCLVSSGVAPGDIVVLKLERSERIVIAALAVLRTGAAYLPLASEWPEIRIQQVLDQTAPALVLDDLYFDRLSDESDGLTADTALPETCPSDPAYVIMTSGTTGRPKGVVVPHRAVAQFCRWAMDRYQWQPGGRSAVQTDFAYDVAIWGVYPALFSGGAVHILDQDTRRSLHRLRDYLDLTQITHLDLPVAMAEEFMARFEGAQAPASLKYLATGGDALGRYRPGPYRVVNEYGPTECTVTVTAVELTPGMDPIPIGSPLPGMRAHIVDSKGRLCPLGVAGELCFSGGQLALGYLGDKTLTAEKFIPNPFYDHRQDPPEHSRLYRTGDRARRQGGKKDDKGNLIFLGRMDQQVKVRGFRVELGEIESILKSHPRIRNAVAAARAYPPGTDKSLFAWVVCEASVFDEISLRFFLMDKLPSYMIPSLIRVDELPLTAGGKIDIDRLPPPGNADHLSVIPPESRAEKALLRTLTELCPGLEENVMASFLDVGGDSMRAIRLAARMEQQGWRVALSDIMGAPSLRRLAEKMVDIATRETERLSVDPHPDFGAHLNSGGSHAWLKGLPLRDLPRPSHRFVGQVEERWGKGATIYPPTATQKMILTQSVRLGRSAYAILGHYRLPDNAPDPGEIRGRLAIAMDRHDILRAVFAQDGQGEPWMVIPEHKEAAFNFFDVSGLSREAGRQQLDLRRRQLLDGLDPFEDTLFSIDLFYFGHARLEMLLHYHHVILDGWSLELLFRELFFAQTVEKETAPAFGHYAQWSSILEQAAGADAGMWWEARFPAHAVPANLPAWPGSPKDPKKLAEPETTDPNPIESLPLVNSEQLLQCAAFARKIRVTPATLFITIWNLVLERYARGADNKPLFFGFVSSGRPPLREIDALVGMCVRTLPMPLAPSSDWEFVRMARELQQLVDDIQSRHGMPLDLPGRMPRHLFAYESATRSGNEEGPLPISVSGDDDYDLVALFRNHPRTPDATLRFNPRAISPDRAGQLGRHIQAMVTRILENADVPACAISALPDSEQNKLLEKYGRGTRVEVKHETVVDAFCAAAHMFPDHAALVCNDRRLNYSQLAQWTDALACRLRDMGAGRGEIVAAVMSRSLAGAAAPLAIMKTGAAYFPLDPSWPEARIAQLLDFTSAVAVVTDLEGGPNFPVGTLNMSYPLKTPNEETQSLPSIDATDPAYVICTSGTTGRPKATVLTHRALINQVAWTRDRFRVSSEDRVLHTVAFSFDPSLWILFPFWAAGACVEIVPLEMSMDSEQLLCHLNEHAVSLLALPAKVGGMLFAHARRCAPNDEEIRDRFPESLRVVLLGGEAPQGLFPANFELINVYGPTETCIQAMAYRIPHRTGATRIIGQPVANMRAYVLDRSLGLCPIGVEGEICLSGPQLAQGYLNMSEETDAVFVSNPHSTEAGHERIYRTGDRGRWLPDGNMEFLGRIDEQVKVRGHRIELAEVQQVLRQAPGVKEAYVLAREDRAAGKRLDAFFIPVGKETSAKQKRGFMRSRLPEYMVPSTFTSVSSWPLNQNGKLDASALPTPTIASKFNESPRGEAEKALAKAWEAVLGVSNVSREDNFFDLGGHSLLFLNVIGHLSSTHTLDLRDFFDKPRLRDLAGAMQPVGRQSDPPVRRSRSLRTIDGASRGEIEEDRNYRDLVKNVDRLPLDSPARVNQMILTGATGFLGAFLLKEYFDHTDADIIVPLRGAADPKVRLMENLQFYFGGHCAVDIVNSARLNVIRADLSRDTDVSRLRDVVKERPVDLLLHSAACVSHYGDPDLLTAGNVTATKNMLALAGVWDRCCFVHVSTLGVVNRPLFTEISTDMGPVLSNIYSRTKQEAEKLVFAARDNGMNTMIFRTGNLVLDTVNGLSPREAKGNMFLRLVRMVGTTGLAAKNAGKIGYVFVDCTARAIRLLAGQACLGRQVFHIDNPHRLTMAKMLSMALPEHKKIALLPRAELKTELEILGQSRSDDMGAAAREYLAWMHQNEIETAEGEIFLLEARMDLTQAILKRLGFSWQPVSKRLAKDMWNRAETLSEEQRNQQVVRKETDRLRGRLWAG